MSGWLDTWLKSGYATLDPGRDDYSPRRPEDSELMMIHSTTPPRRHPPTVYNLPPNNDILLIKCSGPNISQYTIIPSVISSLCFIFGIFYCFFGYRYFKATMFMTGFMFGSLVTYVICREENLLPFEGKIGVAIGAGILCGLITMLVQYVGLFLTGFHYGFVAAVAALSVAEPFARPSTKWVPIGAVLGAGIPCALLSLRFQRVATIVATAAVGAAMATAAVDYFVDASQLLWYVRDRLKVLPTDDPLCWYTWAVVAMGPSIFLVGMVVQFCITGKGCDHYKVERSKRHRRVMLHRTARDEDVREIRPSNYRHLYQIRRYKGDIIAQSYGNETRDGHSRPAAVH